MPAVRRTVSRSQSPSAEQTFEAIVKTDDFPVEIRRGTHDSAQHRVEARAVAAAGQYTDPLFHGHQVVCHQRDGFQPLAGRPTAAQES